MELLRRGVRLIWLVRYSWMYGIGVKDGGGGRDITSNYTECVECDAFDGLGAGIGHKH